jgi:caffeoyl-CoA O-methyltransferase
MADRDSRQGIRYADPAIIEWLDRLHAGLDGPLRAAFEAPDAEDMPAIQVGLSEGRLIGLLAGLAGAKRIVEVGTLAGFSAIHLARALPADGHLWTIEVDSRHAAVARDRIAGAGLADRVTVMVGDGVDVLPKLEAHGPFDVVFIDADKGRYDVYGRWAARHLRPGGILLADNAYFFGRLLADDPEAAAVRRLHEEAAAHFDAVCIPTPDGLLLGRRR